VKTFFTETNCNFSGGFADRLWESTWAQIGNFFSICQTPQYLLDPARLRVKRQVSPSVSVATRAGTRPSAGACCERTNHRCTLCGSLATTPRRNGRRPPWIHQIRMLENCFGATSSIRITQPNIFCGNSEFNVEIKSSISTITETPEPIDDGGSEYWTQNIPTPFVLRNSSQLALMILSHSSRLCRPAFSSSELP